MYVPIAWPAMRSRACAKQASRPWRTSCPAAQEASTMTQERLMVALDPRPSGTRILVMEGRDERLRAVLGSARGTHPRAAATLLEGLALWHQMPLAVALCVSDSETCSALHLYDALGEGSRNVHFDVAIVARDHRARARRLSCLGRFGDLRQLTLEGVGR